MVAVGLSSPDERARYPVEVRRDRRIPNGDSGETLSADVYLPMRGDPAPALVTVLPYRKDAMGGIHYDALLRWFAQHGYACVHVDHAGIGSSDGTQQWPWGPGECEDALAAIDWTAAQPWCTGSVGMWGLSHGAFTSLSAATRQPSPLKAIIPIMGAVDIARDFVHPDGAHSDLGPLTRWGAITLLLQLMPPLLNGASAAEQRRWHRRLHAAEPFVMQLARHAAEDPGWRERMIATDDLRVPTLCVGGWRDVYAEAVPRLFEAIPGPKKLLMGPWMHTLPQDSPFGAIGFRSLALRWWDYWLRGIDNGIMDEPPVTVYVQGHTAGWRAHDSWPPAKTETVLATETELILTEAAADATPTTEVIGEYRPDATIGVSSGLWAFGMSHGSPLDQHDDDTRSVCATTAPLPEALTVCGRPEIAVTLAPDSTAQRVVARLTDVDPQGRSMLITAGVLCPDTTAKTHLIGLRPTCYRIAPGHRLRVAVSDSDFPRLRPIADPSPIPIAHIEATIPTVAPDEGADTDVPPPDETPPSESSLVLEAEPHWTVTRDAVHDGVAVAFGERLTAHTPNREHRLEWRSDTRATVRAAAGDAAVTTGTYTATVRSEAGEETTTTVTIRCTPTLLWARGDVTTEHLTVFTKVWETPLPPPRHD